MRTLSLLGLSAALFVGSAKAHDTWVQANSNLIRVGDVAHVDLMLGNHGNDHRDFKLAGKIDLEACKLEAISPAGKSYDLKSRVTDMGSAPKEGFWSARFVPGEAGLHVVSHQLDKIVNHGKPIRAMKSAKFYFVASPTLDKVDPKTKGFDKPLGHPIELVPRTHPVTPMGPGQPITVELLWKGKPLAGAKVSFIPRGEVLASGTDPKHERITDAEGKASYTPTEGTYHLVVAHHRDPEAKGEGYESTSYAATLCVFVPELCPCCGE